MRYEITIRNLEYAQEIAALLHQQNIQAINLTDKNGMPYNLECAREMLNKVPELQITPHYAFKNHTVREPQQILRNFEGFLNECEELGIQEALLLSGHPRPKFEVLKSIDFIRAMERQPELKFACAYNPYLPDPLLKVENERLAHKLQTDFFNLVYLQIGLDANQLQRGIELIRTLSPDIQITGCLLVPDQKTLNNLKFRPWHGVYMSEDYLNDLELAINATRGIWKVYQEMNVEPLIELPGLKPEHFELLSGITGSAA